MGVKDLAGKFKLKASLPWMAAVLVCAAAAVTMALYVKQAKPPSAQVGMRVEQVGDRMLLSWSRDNPAVRTSTGGVLHIEDGTRRRDVQLDTTLLASGSILYHPETDDVGFRLELHGLDGETITGGIRVLDSAVRSRPASADDSASRRAMALAGEIPEVPTGGNPTPQTRIEPPVAAVTVPQEDAKQVGVTATSSTSIAEQNNALRGRSSPGSQIGSESRYPEAKTEAPVLARSEAPVRETSGTVTTPETAASRAAPNEAIAQSSAPQADIPTPKPSLNSAPPDTTRQLENAGTTGANSASTDKVGRAMPATTTVPPPGQGNENSAAGTLIPPKPIRQVMPDLERMPELRTLGMSAAVPTVLNVEVAVRVNEKGNVKEAHLINGGSKLPPAIAIAALSAARQWTFQPATLRGEKVASDHTIVFQFVSARH